MVEYDDYKQYQQGKNLPSEETPEVVEASLQRTAVAVLEVHEKMAGFLGGKSVNDGLVLSAIILLEKSPDINAASVRNIAALTGLSPTTVRNTLTDLEAADVVFCTEGSGRSGNTYFLDRVKAEAWLVSDEGKNHDLWLNNLLVELRCMGLPPRFRP